MAAAQSSVTSAEQRLSTANSGVSTIQDAVTALTGEVAPAQTAYTAAQADLTTLQSQVAEKQAAVKTAQTDVTSAQTAVTTAGAAVTTAETGVKTAQAEMLSTAKTLERAETTYATAQKATTTATDGVRDANTGLRAADAAVTKADAKVVTADAAVKSAESKVTAATGKVATAQGAVDSAQGRLGTAQGAVSSAQSAYNSARSYAAAHPDDKAAQSRANSALARLNSAKGEVTSATTALSSAKTALSSAQAAERAAKEALERAKEAAAEAKRQAEEAKVKQKAAQEAVKRADEALKAARDAETAAKTALETAKTAVEQAKVALEQAQTALKTATTAQTEAQTKLETATKALAAAEKAYASVQEQVTAAQSKVTAAQAKLDTAKSKLEAKQGELDAARAKVATAQEELTSAKAKLVTAQDAAKQAQAAKEAADLRALQAEDERMARRAAEAQAQHEAQAAAQNASSTQTGQGTAVAGANGPGIAGDTNGDGSLDAGEEQRILRANIARTSQKDPDAVSEAERTQMLQDQAALAASEAAVRAQSPVPVVNMRGLDPSDRHLVNQAAAIATTQQNAAITELRVDYGTTHEYYVDADGTTYELSVDSDNGDLNLARTDEAPASGANPATTTNRTASIHADDSRRDVATTRTVPTGAPNEVNQTRTETLDTDPAGQATASQIQLEQERENADGSTDTSSTVENYDGAGTATDRIEASGHEAADGATSSHEATTTFAADGTSPTNRVVVDSGTDKDGGSTGTTTIDTDYADGIPANTFTKRDGVPLAPGQTETEYVEWGTDGVPTSRSNGGIDRTRSEYEAFVANGTQPEPEAYPPEPVVSRDSYLNGEDQAHAAWEAEVERIDAANALLEINELDPTKDPLATNAMAYTRGNEGVLSGATVNGTLAAPLQPSGAGSTVFDVPGELAAQANAATLDQSAPATDPAAFAQLNEEQATYEAQVAAATTDGERAAVMSAYFADHPYWIDRGTEDSGDVLMASAWSQGAPASEMFGSSRATDPHATMARTGIAGLDDQGNQASVDVVQNRYVDGSIDDIVRTQYEGLAGASRTTVTGEYSTAAGTVIERNQTAESTQPRVDEGKEPLSVTEVVNERFDPVTGLPSGEQYSAVATSDSTTTSLRETRDQYDATGVIYDTTIDSTDMTRNYDADVTADFLAENRRILELGGSSTDGENDLDVNRDGTSITTPPAGSSYAHSHTDVDYDTAGVAIHRTVVEDATSVTSTDGDTNGNGVHITDSHTERELGAAGGTTPIFDAAGANAVGETAVTTVETSDFDPDAGQAGGYNDSSHQYRASSSITLGRTTAPDNTVSGEWATPLTTRELREGHDDDWVFTERHLQTEVDGQPTLEGEGDEAHPIELEAGASITDAHGNATTLANGTTKRESLDFSDNFEAFMEDWGGKAIAIGAIAAGILAVPLSGGASLALTVVGVGLAATSFAYTAINYDQGEASGWDLAIAGAGTALAFLPAINGLRTLGSASRLTSVGGGMVDDAMRAPALVRAATSSAANSTLRVGNVANVAMTGNDVWDAGRQALQGDFAGAGMLLLAAAGGKVASRIRVPRVANGVAGGGADGGGTETSPIPAIDTAAATTTLPVQPIAPSTISTRVPLAGSNTSGAAAAPLTGSTTPGAAAAAASLPAPAATTTAVGGARGGGASSSVVDVDFTNNASFYSNGNRGAANDPNVPKVVPGTTEGSLTGHVGNQHATALEQVDAAYPRMTANRPENIPGFSVGADGVPPIGTIVRTGAGSKLQYSMVVDASGTMRPVTSQGAAAPGAESTYAEVRAANDAVQGVEKWQVPKHQYAPDLADSLGQQNPNLQRLVIDGFTNANGRSIIVDRGTTRTVHSDAGRVTGVDAYGNEVTGLRTEWRKLNGVWEPDTAYPAEAPAATVAAPGSINRPNFMWESAPGGTVRTTAVEGVPQFVVGRTSDGSYLLADGAGNRIPASPAYLVSYHADGVLPQGTDLRVGRTSGTVEDGYRVQGNDTDALTLHMAGNGIERPTRTSEVLALNVDRVLGTGEISTPWGPGRILSGPLVTEPGARPAYDVQLHDGGRFRLDGQDLLTANADTVLRRAGVVGTYETTGNAALDAPRPDLMQYARPVPGESIPFGTAVVGGVPRGMSYGFRGGYDFDVNGVTVRIESPASMPNQRVGEQLDAVHRAIQATPADLNAGVQRINVYEGSNPFDPYWSEVRNSPGFHSQATAGGGVVNFWTGLGSMPTDTYQHEVGHIFGADGGPNNTEAWRRAVELDRANRNGISGSNKVKSRTPYFPVLTHDVDGVTGYGDSAITSQGMFTEDFAESVRLQTLSDQQGYIAVGRRRGLLGAVAGRTNYRFEDLFPHRAEALGAFRQLRAAGLDPAGYSPMWAGGPGAAGSSGMPLAATSADANAGVGWISDFNAAAVNTALIAASAGDDE